MSVAVTTDSSPMRPGYKILVGALGGLCAVMVKYLSQDHATLLRALDAQVPFNLAMNKLFWSYSIVTPITVLLGGIIGWVAEETNRLKLFALGISAPALITTASTGNLPGSRSDLIDLIGPRTAIAQDFSRMRYVDPERTYAIEIDTLLARDEANEAAILINNARSSIVAFAGPQRNDQVPLLVTQKMSLREALELREKLLATRQFRNARIQEVIRR